MTRTFKSLTVLAAIFGTLTQAQQVAPAEELSLEDALKVIPTEEATPILESDSDIKLEQPKKRKGITVPLEPHLYKGENSMLKAARKEKAERDRKQQLQAAPEVTAATDKSFMGQMFDKVFGNKGAQYNQRSFKLEESENTAPSDFYDDTLDLNNLVNLVYTMNLYFGSQKEPLVMAVDTAYDVLVVKTNECTLWDWDDYEDTEETCPGVLYDVEISDDYNDFDESITFLVENPAVELYGAGFNVVDTVCLDAVEEDLCVSDYLWLDARQQVGLSQAFTGVFGLPTGVSNSALPPPYLKSLSDANMFTENIFAIAFKGYAETTFMDIGEVFDENMSDEDDIVYFSFSGIRWQTTISGIQFGENDARQFIVPTGPANFDSNNNMILVPEDQWETIINQLVRELEYDQYTIDLETFTCTTVCNPDLYYDMYFFLGGEYWAQVLAEDFIVDLSLAQNGASCQIAISNSTNHLWTLGTPFLRGYYIVFDGENLRTGVVPYAGSPKEELYTGEQPEETLTLDEASNWATYGFLFAILVVIGFELGGSYFGN